MRRRDSLQAALPWAGRSRDSALRLPGAARRGHRVREPARALASVVCQVVPVLAQVEAVQVAPARAAACSVRARQAPELQVVEARGRREELRLAGAAGESALRQTTREV